MAAKAEIYQSKDGWRFRIKAGNGEVVATGEAYSSEDGAKKGVAAVARAASEAVDGDNIVTVEK